MKKYRLMQITHDLAIGGLQQVVVNICKTIDRNKFDVSVLCLRNLGEFVPEIEKMGIKVFCLPQKRNGTDYLSFLKVGKILRREKIEIIHTHNTQPLVDGTIGALMSGVKNIVHTDHARGTPNKKRWIFLEWLMSNFVYKYVCVSDHTAHERIRDEKIPCRKIMTIMNGIDGKKYNFKLNAVNKRKELGIRKTGPIIGLGVRLSEQKGITYLLKAMPEIIKKIPDITLVIAGKGPLEESLKKEAIDLKIDKHVKFIGARLDMPELLKLFDLYVLPSLWEGLPMVLLEAMAAGCPIIATGVGGNRMAIKNGINGSLVTSKNHTQLSEGIIYLLTNNKIRNIYSQNGIKLFHQKFNADTMTHKYEYLYLRNG